MGRRTSQVLVYASPYRLESYLHRLQIISDGIDKVLIRLVNRLVTKH